MPSLKACLAFAAKGLAGGILVIVIPGGIPLVGGYCVAKLVKWYRSKKRATALLK